MFYKYKVIKFFFYSWVQRRVWSGPVKASQVYAFTRCPECCGTLTTSIILLPSLKLAIPSNFKLFTSLFYIQNPFSQGSEPSSSPSVATLHFCYNFTADCSAVHEVHVDSQCTFANLIPIVFCFPVRSLTDFCHAQVQQECEFLWERPY